MLADEGWKDASHSGLIEVSGRAPDLLLKLLGLSFQRAVIIKG
jgi:hypothetical protein